MKRFRLPLNRAYDDKFNFDDLLSELDAWAIIHNFNKRSEPFYKLLDIVRQYAEAQLTIDDYKIENNRSDADAAEIFVDQYCEAVPSFAELCKPRQVSSSRGYIAPNDFKEKFIIDLTVLLTDQVLECEIVENEE